MNVDHVLVRAKKPRASEVHHALSRIPGVREVHSLFGEWDLIAKVDVEPALGGTELLFTIATIEGVIESKWLGVARRASIARSVSDLSNTQMRSDAL